MENLKKPNSHQTLKENSKEIIQEFGENDKGQKLITIYKEILKHIKNIKWAPLNIPLRRRLQTLSAGIYVFVFMGSLFVMTILTAFLAVSFQKHIIQ